MEKNFYEIYQKYMSMSKETLAELLAAKEMNENRYDEEPINIYRLKRMPLTEEPFGYETTSSRCKKWEECQNPFHDCINCPLRHTTGGNYSTNVCVSGGCNSSISTKDYKDSSFYTTSSNKDVEDNIMDRLRKMTD